MTDPTSPSPIDSLKVAFASTVIAQAQGAYINKLIEMGASPEIAVRLTESTTTKLLDTGTDILGNLTELIKVLGQNAPAIAQALQSTITFINEMERSR